MKCNTTIIYFDAGRLGVAAKQKRLIFFLEETPRDSASLLQHEELLSAFLSMIIE